MKKTSLFLALMATSILSAYAHGEEKDNKEKGVPVRQAQPNQPSAQGEAGQLFFHDLCAAGDYGRISHPGLLPAEF